MVKTRHISEDSKAVDVRLKQSARGKSKSSKTFFSQDSETEQSNHSSTDDTQPDYSRPVTITTSMDPSIARHTRHMRHRRVVNDTARPDQDLMDLDEGDDTDEDVDLSPKRHRYSKTRSNKRYTRKRKEEISDGDDTEEDTEEDNGEDRSISPSHHRLRRCTHPPARMLTSEYEVIDSVVGGIRRSGRQRKSVYSSFNQNLINKHLSYPEERYHNSRGKNNRRKQMERKSERRVLRRSSRYQTKREQEAEDSDDGDDDDDDGAQSDENDEMANMDMYTRVKRERKQVKRDMYGMPRISSNNNDDSSSESSSEDAPGRRCYDLRVNKPRTELYKAPVNEPRHRTNNMFDQHKPKQSYKYTHHSTSAHRSSRYQRRPRKNLFGSSSTSSSSSEEMSGDDARFERRKRKSMAKARNRCLPMNISPKDMAQGILKERTKIGSSLADVDPMTIDRTINFDSVGGLGKHVKALKEMVVFPLMYPEVFEKFKISPPRGVLFYGPPGTGKTLVARALANDCSNGEHKVAFFMRKGADCLSKWVGESERQLRLLFDQAYQMRPSIIFFDEIDGLAPIRSSRQDQIHSSIVSTLLALMDGLDSRGEVVVIGATNRLDSIDPALRRPGRFDREFSFPLPSVEARAQILSIHMKAWNPKPSNAFLCELAEKTVGYCGADLHALCTEAALHGFRRRYPQVYGSKHKLQLDVDTINVSAGDFKHAMAAVIPTSQRSVSVPARRLPMGMQPLLQNLFDHTITLLNNMFAAATLKKPSGTNIMAQLSSNDDGIEHLYSDDDYEVNIYDNTGRHGRPSRYHTQNNVGLSNVLNTNSNAISGPQSFRPRLLICGEPGQGQSTHLAPAVLHYLEGNHVHLLDMATLYANSARTPEEACAQVFREASRNHPSIIYIPHISRWWTVAPASVQQTFMTLVEDILPEAPILILATAETQINQIPCGLDELFSVASGQVVTMQNPISTQRREFFMDLLLIQTKKPPVTRRNAAQRILEVLPKAKPPPPRTLSEAELKRLHKQEEATMRELRLFLRDVINKLSRDRKFAVFAKPVDASEVEDYYEVIRNPMDLCTIMSKIDLHEYQTVKQMMCDIDLICSNALEYNPDNDPNGRSIRHRACALRDTAQAIIEAEFNPEFEKTCEETLKAIQARGESPMKHVPDFYHTKPAAQYKPQMASIDEHDKQEHDSLENLANDCPYPGLRRIVKICTMKRKTTSKNVSPWCKPTRRARKKRIIVYVDDFGNEVDISQYNKESTINTDQSEHDKEKDENTESNNDVKEEKRFSKKSPQPSPVMPIITRRSSHSPRVKPDYDTTSESSKPARRSSHRLSSNTTPTQPPVLELYGEQRHSDSTDSPVIKRKRTRSNDGTEEPKAKQDSILPAQSRNRPNDEDKKLTHNVSLSPKPPLSKSNNTTPVKTHSPSSPHKVDQTSTEPRVDTELYQCALSKSARHELSTPIRVVTGVDDQRLYNLLELTVKLTSQWNVEQLQRLYTQIASNIYQHRNEHDKSLLIEDIERIVQNASI